MQAKIKESLDAAYEDAPQTRAELVLWMWCMAVGLVTVGIVLVAR